MVEADLNSQLHALDASGESQTIEEGIAVGTSRVRKGAVWGAWAGLVFGTMWLVISVTLGALAGALIAKAAQLRIEKGSSPRIRFDKAYSKPKRPAAEGA